MGEFIKGKIPITKFIEHHCSNFINYCEVVIHPDGDVEYCIPSHQETLIRLTGIDRERLWNELDYSCDIIKELCNRTGCVCVWFTQYVLPDNFTGEQYKSLLALRDAKCIIF